MSGAKEKSSIDEIWPFLSDEEKISMCVYSSRSLDIPTCAHCGFQGDKEKHFGVLVHLIPTKGGKFSSSAKNSVWLCLKCFGTIPADQLITRRKDGEHFPVMFSYKSQVLDADGQLAFRDCYFMEETIGKFFPQILERIKQH